MNNFIFITAFLIRKLFIQCKANSTSLAKQMHSTELSDGPFFHRLKPQIQVRTPRSQCGTGTCSWCLCTASLQLWMAAAVGWLKSMT